MRATRVRGVCSALLTVVRRRIPVRVINRRLIRLGVQSRDYFPVLSSTSYEPLEWLPIKALAPRGGTLVDVGANIGVLTILMSRVVGPTGRVIAVEPMKVVGAMLEDNIRRNGCQNVEYFQGVFGASAGEVEFFVSEATGLGVSSSTTQPEGASSRMTVLSTTINKYLENTPVDYIKIDTEGAEVDVLEGAGTILSSLQPMVQIEVHGQYLGRYGPSIRELFQLMASFGYAAINLATCDETTHNEFSKDTGYRVADPITKDDLGLRGYGHVLFVESSRVGKALGVLRRARGG
jgi:FkbM family methyltransferase